MKVSRYRSISASEIVISAPEIAPDGGARIPALRASAAGSCGGSGAPAGTGYRAIYSTEGAFAALTADGHRCPTLK